jgi:hypothetical protein
VKLPDGSVATPGKPTQAAQMPSMQGAQGVTGGANPAAGTGLPNLNSTNNPTIALAAPTPTNRPRARRRGGALPGVPQRQGLTKPTPQNVAA